MTEDIKKEKDIDEKENINVTEDEININDLDNINGGVYNPNNPFHGH